jgi:hypothetical protein
MLKAIKHLSMNATLLEVLQNANAIEILTRILDEQSSGLHSTVRHDDEVVLAPVFIYTFSRKCRIIYSRRATTFVV